MPGSALTRLDDLARAVLERYAINPVPPIDVHELAHRMGVDSIETASMVEDGRLEHNPADIRIYLKSGMPRSRHRFTLAHELGHLLLADPDSSITARRYWTSQSHEERFCDAFAGSLLMPSWWLAANAAGSPDNLETLRALSDRAGTSLAATILRLHDALGWTKSLLRWTLFKEHWRFAAGAAVPRHMHGNIRSGPDTSSVIESAQPRGMAVHVDLPIFLENRPQSMFVELMVFGKTAIALADLAGLDPGAQTVG